MITAVFECCAGIDVGKQEAVVCLMKGPAAEEPRVEYRRFATFTRHLEEMKNWLTEEGCSHVLMESTGSYWKPIFNVLESGMRVYLANAEDVKGRKGHKTDQQDSWWLAHLFRHAMVRTSFIPPRAIRELRDLTRRRRRLLGMATSEKNRVQKVLEDANVKLGSVLSDVFGVSGQLILDALLKGTATPEQMAELAQKKAREKIPEIIESLAGHRMREHHRTMVQMSLDVLQCLERQILQVDEEIMKRIEAGGYLTPLQLIESVPGVCREGAKVVLAETGGNMEVFPKETQLSSWAGLCPGNKRSAGKDFRGRTTRGNTWLRSTLVECAWAASRMKRGRVREQYRRLAPKGKKQALIAVAHLQLLLIHRALRTGLPYQEPDIPPVEERKRQKMIQHHIRCLGRLGVSVGSTRPANAKTNKCKSRTVST